MHGRAAPRRVAPCLALRACELACLRAFAHASRLRACVHVYLRFCVRACSRGCVLACRRACLRVFACLRAYLTVVAFMRASVLACWRVSIHACTCSAQLRGCIAACLCACACLRVCVPACVRGYMSACLHIRMLARLRAFVPSCLRVCVSMPACPRACLFVFPDLCVLTGVHRCVLVCLGACGAPRCGATRRRAVAPCGAGRHGAVQ